MLEAEDPVDLYHAVVSSSFDADRLDYLRRDRFMTGTEAGAIDFDWLMEHVRVREVELEAADLDDEFEEAPARVPTFCLDRKALPAAEQFLLARYTLTEQVYLHKTARCVEHLIGKLLRRVADLARSDTPDSSQVGLPPEHPVWRFFSAAAPSVTEYLALDDSILLAALEPMSRAPDAAVADLASRLRTRRLYKTLDLRSFGQDEGRQNSRARAIDSAVRANEFTGVVDKDEGAKVGIYTQIGGDDERTHKKLHVLDAGVPREITLLSSLIGSLPKSQQFTRYFFENESDREMAKRVRKV